ncbi:MAG: hypothetical protein ACE5HV_05450 [Acidobacteriota bacterium]
MSQSLEWRCPACQRPGVQELDDAEALACVHCGHSQPLAAASLQANGAPLDPLVHCLCCGSKRLFTQKDFNRRLGLAIVVAGAVLSPWTYGASLLVCMLIDYGLYYLVPEITVCYGCDAIHRGFGHNPAHRAHDPLLAERFRREAREEVEGRSPD